MFAPLGRERALLGIKEAVPGKDLQCTLDLDLQTVAELAMENRRGAVVALDPRTGEVLAVETHPLRLEDGQDYVLLVERGILAEMPKDLDKPIKV